jgi:quercetin dioxygenase-like cupin family protein
MNKVNLFESSRFFCDVYCLLPGQAQRPHVHESEDKVYHVLDGNVIFRDGENEIQGASGDALWAPAGQMHGVENRGTTPAVLLVFMAPHPRPVEKG